MTNKKSIPSRIKKLIFQEAQSQCPFCGERDVNVLEIHHITERADNGTNDPHNLILLCSNCHSKITSGAITTLEVLSMKKQMSNLNHPSQGNGKPTNVISISGGQQSGVVANVLNIKTAAKKSPKLSHPRGSIGSELLLRNYIKYLIDRYNEFKKADRNLSSFSYAVIYRSIRSEFKTKWDFIPVQRFPDLASYLQDRIDKTILGKVRKARGHKNYETFEEFQLNMESQRAGE